MDSVWAVKADFVSVRQENKTKSTAMLVRLVHGLLQEADTGLKDGAHSLEWKLLIWCMSKKVCPDSWFASTLYGPLHMHISVSSNCMLLLRPWT